MDMFRSVSQIDATKKRIAERVGRRKSIQMNTSAHHRRKLADGNSISLKNTLQCGQCFRWRPCGENAYFGIVNGNAAIVSHENDAVYIETDFELTPWKKYFDLYRDYDRILRTFGDDPFTTKAIEFGKGLRILRQQPWETLCSYIMSSCNNIKRISGIVERICVAGNEQVLFNGQRHYSFPSPETVADFSDKTLDSLEAGYRTKWLKSAAAAVLDGDINFDYLHSIPTDEARTVLMSLPGVGPKVANCVLLFGLGKLDAFPVDTWMKKASKYYDGGFAENRFGEYAGIAQEYIFNYIRNLE